MVFKKEDLILNFDRIITDATNFIRGNPIISAGVGLGTPLVLVGISKVRSRSTKKKTTVKKRKARVKRRKIKARTVRRKKVTHRSPRHKGHKKVSFVTAEGKRVSFLVKQPKHTHRRRGKRS